MANSHAAPGPTSAPGWVRPTSRCQTPPSIWLLGGIGLLSPNFLAHPWAMALPFRTTGSLWPAFAPARIVILAVKRAYAIALTTRCPTVFSPPSCSSVLFGEGRWSNYPPGTVRNPDSGTNVRTSKLQGWWYFGTTPPHLATRFQRKSPTYPTHVGSMFSAKL